MPFVMTLREKMLLVYSLQNFYYDGIVDSKKIERQLGDATVTYDEIEQLVNKLMDEPSFKDIGSQPTLRSVVEEFVSDVDAAGGAFVIRCGAVGLHADPEWSNLGELYKHACEALGRPMKLNIGEKDDSDLEEILRDEDDTPEEH